MVLIQWRDEYRTGVESVDFEHLHLIDLINDAHEKILGQGDKEAVTQCLGEIYAQISAHFALEEKIMRDRRYAEYAAHKEEHEALLDSIREIMDRHERGVYVNYEEDLAEHLSDWFAHHFRTMDARLHGLFG